ncbi:Carboxylesterase NlhH [Planctomycetales bacterium 10988]|nr:Carboxylesterase NlhH [Planctomycetales bacterium 10988]
MQPAMTFKIRFLAFLLSAGLLLTTTGFAQQRANQRTQVPQETLDRLEAHRDLTYAKYGDRELQLDLFRPKQKTEPLPAIVCIHGGGWWQGTRGNQEAMAQTLADRGFVVVTITYRLSGETGFPAQINDCKAAVRWLRANADKYGINPDQIGATGLSAGGHLTALLATSGGVKELEGNGGNPDQSSTIQAAVALGASTDFLATAERISNSIKNPSKDKPNIWMQFMGGSPNELPEKYKLASPITHLDQNDPPLAFVTGEQDRDHTRATETREKMKELGVPTQLTVVEGAPHAFLGRQEWFSEGSTAIGDWFVKHLKQNR